MGGESGKNSRNPRGESWFGRSEPVITCIAAVFGVLTYVYEIVPRAEARITAAWQVLVGPADHQGNYGQKWALAVLNGCANKHDLHGVHVTEADLSSDPGKPEQALDLRHANLAYSVLYHSNLRAARLSQADLSFANLRGTALGQVDFSGAHLQCANLDCADVSDANFTGAAIPGASWDSACYYDQHPPKGLPPYVLNSLQRQCGGAGPAQCNIARNGLDFAATTACGASHATEIEAIPPLPEASCHDYLYGIVLWWHNWME